jgi:hypothetical protein
MDALDIFRLHLSIDANLNPPTFIESKLIRGTGANIKLHQISNLME